jgi:hypothetical protein
MLRLDAIAERIVQLFPGEDRGQVAIVGAGVAVTRCTTLSAARGDYAVLRAAISQVLGQLLPLESPAISQLTDRLLTIDETDGRATIRVCGSELAGIEDIQTATDRALAMRAVLIAELQRALSDEPPATVRRSVPPSSAEAR